MPHTIKVKIYYEDTDAGGVVYYANYLRYFERARTELLAGQGIDVAGYHKKGTMFVVSSADVKYRKPARLGDLIDVTTEVSEVKNASIVLRHTVLRDGETLVEASVSLACIDEGGRPSRLPEDFKGLAGR